MAARLRFTRRAEEDLEDIADFTRQRWGEAQRDRYLDDLEACCRRLAESPGLGRACAEIRAGYFRAEQGRHVIFFRMDEEVLVVVRILHAQMLPERHLSGEPDEEE